MILYFTGTGNSEYVAEKIGKALHEETLNLFEKIKTKDTTPLYSKKLDCCASHLCLENPTYCRKLDEGNRVKWKSRHLFCYECGDSIGNAGKYLEHLCDSKKMNYKGCTQIVMPENYFALFKTPSKSEAIEYGKHSQGLPRYTCPK